MYKNDDYKVEHKTSTLIDGGKFNFFKEPLIKFSTK